MEILVEAGRLYERDVQIALRFETRYVCNLYERSLPMKKLPPGFWRVLIGGDERARSATFNDDGGGVLEVVMPLPLSRLLGLNDEQHAQAVLRHLDESMAACVKEYGWPAELFAAAHADVVAAGFRNRWLLATKWSPDRRHRAELDGELTRRFFAATLRIKAADGTVVMTEEIMRTRPHERDFVPAIGKCSWASKSAFTIADGDGKALGKWSISPKTATR